MMGGGGIWNKEIGRLDSACEDALTPAPVSDMPALEVMLWGVQEVCADERGCISLSYVGVCILCGVSSKTETLSSAFGQ